VLPNDFEKRLGIALGVIYRIVRVLCLPEMLKVLGKVLHHPLEKRAKVR
jgi:hypothetical protein